MGAPMRGDDPALRDAEQIVAADAGIVTSGTGTRGPEEADVPPTLKYDLDLFLHLLRQVLSEYDAGLLDMFDQLLVKVIRSSRLSDLGSEEDVERAIEEAVSLVHDATTQQKTILARAITSYFHLANLSEENYRVSSLRSREFKVGLDEECDPVNEMTGAYAQLIQEVGEDRARELLNRLEFHPVFTAHPTEARRKATEGKIRRIASLLEEHRLVGGADLAENERRLSNEIDALFRTSPIALKKPTPVQETDTVLALFDSTLFETVPRIYRRFDDWILGDDAGRVEPVCPAFFRPGCWIGSDRDGNPNVTARVSRSVARKFSEHVLAALERSCRYVATNLTLEASTTPASSELLSLWSHQREMSEQLTERAQVMSVREPHRAVMLVMADRMRATMDRDADKMYASAEDFLADLRVVQRSLVSAGARRAAYGPLQDLIWQVETFGFHMVEMEFRQHSIVHTRALNDIREHGLHGERGQLDPMTQEVLDTFRALGAIQRRGGLRAARRYIVSMTKSARNIRDVYELNRLAFSHSEDVPVIDVIPLFEQLEDLEGCVDVLDDMLLIPEVRTRLRENGRAMEIMLGYSDSSKDAGPTSATLALHAAQERIASWARKNDIDLTLFHGRGGAVGRGGGPANRAVLAQPAGSVNCRFKLTEQGEVLFARYGNKTLATRHVESVAAATLLNSAPSVERTNSDMTTKYAPMAQVLDRASNTRFCDLIHSRGFAPWFSYVTPLTEIGLLPIGSRPAKRGLGAKSLDDLRTIPWVFAWSQARINLAAWYGLGTACEELGDLELLRSAYREWPLFSTFVDNIEMSLSKTNERIATVYLNLAREGDVVDEDGQPVDGAALAQTVLEEYELTRRWVLAIVGDDWPLQHRHVLGRAVRIREPYVDALSIIQVTALRAVRDLDPASARDEQATRDLLHLILCTVSGVAAGLQNTG